MLTYTRYWTVPLKKIANMPTSVKHMYFVYILISLINEKNSLKITFYVNLYFKTIKINLYNKHSAKKKNVCPPPPALVCVQASFEQSSFDKMCKVLPRINSFLAPPPPQIRVK